MYCAPGTQFSYPGTHAVHVPVRKEGTYTFWMIEYWMAGSLLVGWPRPPSPLSASLKNAMHLPSISRAIYLFFWIVVCWSLKIIIATSFLFDDLTGLDKIHKQTRHTRILRTYKNKGWGKEGMTLRLGTRACRVIIEESIHKRKKRNDLGATPSTVIHEWEGESEGGQIYDDAERVWDRTQRTKVTVNWNGHDDGWKEKRGARANKELRFRP